MLVLLLLVCLLSSTTMIQSMHWIGFSRLALQCCCDNLVFVIRSRNRSTVPSITMHGHICWLIDADLIILTDTVPPVELVGVRRAGMSDEFLSLPPALHTSTPPSKEGDCMHCRA